MTRPATKTLVETALLAAALTAGAIFATLTMPTIATESPMISDAIHEAAYDVMGVDVDVHRLNAIASIG